MIKGTLKFFSAAKGFGFITPDGDGKDVFLPAATITAAGAARLQAGQRVSFEQEADVKGPKAVRLKLLDEAPKPAPAPRANITVYYDPATPEAADVLEALSAAGHQPRLVDYAATPPARDELTRMSLALREINQSLVRRYDALFLDLQLDDRFIGESEFWTAIIEHPALINGPVLAEGNKLRICKTAADVRAFLGLGGPEEAKPKRKEISPRMAAMIRGQAVPPAAKPEPVAAPKAMVEEKPTKRPAAKSAEAPKDKAKTAPKKAAAPVKKPAKPAPAKKAKAPAVKKKKK